MQRCTSSDIRLVHIRSSINQKFNYFQMTLFRGDVEWGCLSRLLYLVNLGAVRQQNTGAAGLSSGGRCMKRRFAVRSVCRTVYQLRIGAKQFIERSSIARCTIMMNMRYITSL